MLRLSANMEQSEEFRDDVRKAVHQRWTRMAS